MPLPLVALMAIAAGSYFDPYPYEPVPDWVPRRPSRRAPHTGTVMPARRAALMEARQQLAIAERTGGLVVTEAVLSSDPWTRAKQLQHGIGTRKAGLPAKATQPRHVRRQAQKAARRERFAAAGGFF